MFLASRGAILNDFDIKYSISKSPDNVDDLLKSILFLSDDGTLLIYEGLLGDLSSHQSLNKSSLTT